MRNGLTSWATTAGVAMLGLFLAGCDSGGKGAATASNAKATAVQSADAKHGGWWCDEHGLPEAECSMCSAKVAAEFKKNGDWCDEHDRAKSQCFICNPKLKEKYAALYRAKYGKEPTPIEDEKKPSDKK